MRIISGKYGGRILEAPKDRDIRPTSDKVRGAMFNALQSRDAVFGARVIDCFCGSGALGFEALSVGAKDCVFIDKNRTALDLAKRNATALGAEHDALFFLKDATNMKARPDDIAPRTLAFLDPPYKQDLIGDTLDTLNIRDWLAPGAVCVVEAEKNFVLAMPKFFEEISEKIYGDTKVLLLKYVV